MTAAPDTPDTPQQVRVLLVEDNPVIRDLIRLSIQRFAKQASLPPTSIEIFEVADGATAWDRLEDNDFHLVIVDLYLPILGGIELITRIRSDEARAGLKILAMSASFIDAKDRSLGAGADQFLQKPLRIHDVLDSLQTLLAAVLP